MDGMTKVQVMIALLAAGATTIDCMRRRYAPNAGEGRPTAAGFLILPILAGITVLAMTAAIRWVLTQSLLPPLPL